MGVLIKQYEKYVGVSVLKRWRRRVGSGLLRKKFNPKK